MLDLKQLQIKKFHTANDLSNMMTTFLPNDMFEFYSEVL